MNESKLCRHHSEDVRFRLHADPTLGCGNFISKVLAESVDSQQTIFVLERPWVSPAGREHVDFSLSSLRDAVAELACWYDACGVRCRQIVCTYTSEGISQFLHALALISIRAVPAPVNWRMRPEVTLLYYRRNRFDHLTIDTHANSRELRAIVMTTYGPDADASIQELGKVNVLDATPIDGSKSAGELPSIWPARFGTEDDTVMICHSSGTTGVPKAVLFGHQQFFVGKLERLLTFLQRNDERMLSALPHSHSAGFSYLMTAVLLGLPTLVLSEPCGENLSNQIAAWRPTIMAAFSQTYSALAQSVLEPASLDSLRRFFNTGDTAHEAHIRCLLVAAPQATFHDGFGASELGMALFTSVSSLSKGIATGRSVGRPVHFAEIRIVDEQDCTVPTGAVGYLAIRSPSITAGYYQDPEMTRRCRTSEGEWLTGDVGYVDDRGVFFHLDRGVDVLRTPRGAAYSLLLEENVLRDDEITDITIIGVDLPPRVSHMVLAIIQVPSATAERCCQRVLDLLDRMLTQELLGRVPITVANWDSKRPQQTGSTGKALKRLLRDNFWTLHQSLLDGKESALTYSVSRNL